MEKNFLQGILNRILFLYPRFYLIFSFFFFCNWLALNRSRSSTKSIRIGRRQRARLEPEMDDFKMCESCCNLQKFSMPRSRYWCCARIKSPIFLAIFSAYVRKCTRDLKWIAIRKRVWANPWSEANNINICFYKINFEWLVIKKKE